MALYVFGDIHGPAEIGKLTPRRFPAEPTLTEEDYVVVCGDFGFPFLPTDVMDEEKIPFDLPFARRQAVQTAAPMRNGSIGWRRGPIRFCLWTATMTTTPSGLHSRWRCGTGA